MNQATTKAVAVASLLPIALLYTQVAGAREMERPAYRDGCVLQQAPRWPSHHQRPALRSKRRYRGHSW